MVSMDNKEKDSPQLSISISMSDGKDEWFFIICKFYLLAYNIGIEFKQFTTLILSSHRVYLFQAQF